ncbi:MAG: glucuronate isomerase [Acidobacteria bacterium]|nr:glucuronate isomerase [Acidobacteriota bacterium]MCG3191451.1 Uronate isomerase [Thermoanaerobaculia bacterium]MCK6681529.1 glucuronate isomerase [Thermoanaerobaculia bacterium]
MKPFIHDDFLLSSPVASELFHGWARDLPIIDYHCHLPVAEIAGDHRFETITEIWLKGDHYKWRAMRTNGVPERYCTGDATDREKFEAFARTVPSTLRNPLYHWTHMELKRPFGIDLLLDGSTAGAIWERTNLKLSRPEFSAQGLLRQFRVATVCTTDDPVDGLSHHAALSRREDPDTIVLPTYRPDRAGAIDDPASWNAWVEQLEAASGLAIGSWGTFLEALERRHRAFHEAGCRASDHGLTRIEADSWDESSVSATFTKLRRGEAAERGEASLFRSALLHELALMDHGRGWVQQYHLGALRNNNSRMRRILGPDTGFDSIGDFPQAESLARFLDRLDENDRLAKTVLYNLNPRDNELFATMTGNFQDGSVAGKLQYGSAWWFLDQKDGMEKQIGALSNMGLLARFIGMVTDSRSFLSYSRHEYFRRLLCEILGNDVEKGLLPRDLPLLGRLVEDVSFFNARAYLGIPLGRLGRTAGRRAA